ncbi:MAG: tetratricopeptide repeat protein [Muribaculaceae bacterium]|nr:tetratricopeptide repeat protein [Muribaculaceae bacterium]
MTHKEIKQFRTRVAALIDARRLREAIAELKGMAQRRLAWAIGDRLEQTEQAYAYMLRYVADGADDPERASVYDGIVADLYSALDQLAHFLEKAESPTLYYSAVRTRELAQSPGIGALLSQWAEAADKMSLFSIVASGDNTDGRANRQAIERLQRDLFAAIWTTPILSAADSDALAQALASDAYPRELKLHMISAITLGLMQMWDARKMEILIGAYMAPGDVKVTSAALVGMLLGLWMHRSRPLPRRVADMLASAKDAPQWQSDLRTAYIEMIRARDTERINKKITDEVIPDMLNLRPELMDKINGGQINPTDATSLQENPEWQELLDKNGITDKLKELTEIQMEGGDVMMSTFAHLKTFPFFNEVSNWFLPFTIRHSDVADSAAELGIVSEMIENASFMCDSDKYSFMLALRMVPEQQRQLMSSQFKAQSSNIYEAMGEAQGATAPEARRMAVNSYMQNIYRFFKLFSRRREFFDPFDSGINLISVPALASDFDDPELLSVVAEFYFKLNYMADALDVFKRLEAIDGADAQRYQKMGYCAEHLRDYAQAINYYQKAELLDAQSAWTAKRLAACYRAVGDREKALQYYRRLAADQPDNLQLALLYGYALTESGDYAGAVKQFYKVEFLNEKSTKAWRPLAWTLFLTGDYEASKRYYDRILTDNPKPGDYLNIGHAHLASGDMKQAINAYVLSVQLGGGDREAFMQSLTDDSAHLTAAGVSPKMLPLIADAVFYALEK